MAVQDHRDPRKGIVVPRHGVTWGEKQMTNCRVAAAKEFFVGHSAFDYGTFGAHREQQQKCWGRGSVPGDGPPLPSLRFMRALVLVQLGIGSQQDEEDSSRDAEGSQQDQHGVTSRPVVVAGDSSFTLETIGDRLQ
jgi:hypothetical protein